MKTHGRHYGYARASTSKQGDSNPTQRREIEGWANREEVRITRIYEEVASANNIAFRKRPAFAELMLELRRGDTLVLYRLDRLDRNLFELTDAANYLDKAGVRLVSLIEFAGQAVDTSSLHGRIVIIALGLACEITRHLLKNNTSAGLKTAKAKDHLIGGVPFGRRVVKRKGRDKNGCERVLHCVQWDVRECNDLVELVQRRRRGETFYKIANDWWGQRRKRASRTCWTRPMKGKFRADGRPLLDWRPLKRAYQWAEKELAETGKIGIATLTLGEENGRE